MVLVDTEQRQKGITMYFTFLYNTFQNHDLMRPWRANWRPWDKAGTFVYTRFGLTFRSVSVLAPIFRKYPLSRWWICLVSDPSPKLHSVSVWIDELNLGSDLSTRWPGAYTAPPSLCPARGFICCATFMYLTRFVFWWTLLCGWRYCVWLIGADEKYSKCLQTKMRIQLDCMLLILL